MALATPPFGSSRFIVEIDGIVALGFSEIVMPEFPVAGDGNAPLILRRGATASPALYEWWDQARSGGRDAARDLMVMVLDDSGREGLRWRFLGAHPLSMSWSALVAGQPGVLLETLTLGFKRMEMG